MITIPSTVQTSNSDVRTTQSLASEGIVRVNGMQDVTDKQRSRKPPQKKNKKEQQEQQQSEEATQVHLSQEAIDEIEHDKDQSVSSQSTSQDKTQTDSQSDSQTFNSLDNINSSKAARMLEQDRRSEGDRRKTNTNNYLIDSRTTNTRRTRDKRYPRLDITI